MQHSASAEETKRLGRLLAKTLTGQRKADALVVALEGELGAGKTTFVQGFARGLGVKEKTLSPTFVLMQPFKLLNIKTFKPLNIRPFSVLWHVDCYRLDSPAELVRLGFKDILKDPKNVVVVEWADKIRGLLPKDAIWIWFEHGKEKNGRTISINKYRGRSDTC